MKKYFFCIMVLVFSFISLAGFFSCGPRSTGVQGIAPAYTDIPYASVSPAQKLDMYLPREGKAPYPVIISIHGGAFAFGDKADGQQTPMLEGIKKGYAVVSVNYRLSGEAKWPAQIHDIKAAIKFIRVHAAEYSLDEGHIALWGASAGAHLAALAGVSADVKSLEDPSLGNASVSTKVQAVVDWFGPIDFAAMDGQWKKLGIKGEKHSTPGSWESRLMGAPLLTVPALAATSNPERYITASAPPFYIQHGTMDDIIPSLQSAHFAEKLKAVTGADKVIFEYLEGEKHASSGFLKKENVDKILKFLDMHLKK